MSQNDNPLGFRRIEPTAEDLDRFCEDMGPQTRIDVSAQEAQAAKEGYLHKDAVGLDQFANVVTGGQPDETISSRMQRWSARPSGIRRAIGKAMCWWLGKIQKDHGQKAEAGDLQRARAVAKTEREALGIGAKRRRIG